MRAYRLHVATRERRHGGRLRPHTVRGSHSALATFMRWADAEGYDVDLRILDLPGTRLPALDAEAFHMEQLLAILEAATRPRRRRRSPSASWLAPVCGRPSSAVWR